MTRLPRITGREIVAALRKAGFEVARIKGAITSFVTPTVAEPLSRSTWVGETIGPGLLAAILRDCEIEREVYRIAIATGASGRRTSGSSRPRVASLAAAAEPGRSA